MRVEDLSRPYEGSGDKAMRLFKEVIFTYTLVVFVAAGTSTTVLVLDLVQRHAGADQWARGFVAGTFGCWLLVGLMRLKRSR